MQIAGFDCVFCSRRVVLESEGEACSVCGAAAHRKCAEGVGVFCPCCCNFWRDIRKFVVYAIRCPSCGRDNTSPQREACPTCHAVLAFDSVAELREERRRVRTWGFLEVGTGVTLICVGAALVSGAFLLGAYSYGVTLLAIPAGLYGLVQGAKVLARSRTALRFR